MPNPNSTLADEGNPDEFTRALGQLRLVPASISPQQIWYRGGFEAGRRQARVWRVTTVVMTSALVATVAWHHQTLPLMPVNRMVYVRAETSPTPTESPSTGLSVQREASVSEHSSGYLRLLDVLSEHGVDALPRPTVGGGGVPRPLPTEWPLAPGSRGPFLVYPVSPGQEG